jgi:DNA-binding NarL/FixJ family response regulator
VRIVAGGEQLLAPEVTRKVIEQYTRAPQPGGTEVFSELSGRELEVIRQVSRGRSNAEVGAELGLSEATVKTHLTSILRKLALRDRTQLVVLAYERGLVKPGADG